MESLAKSLNLERAISCYTLKTMSGVTPCKSKYMSMKISVCNESMLISGIKVVKSILVSSALLEQSKYPYLRDLDLSAYTNCHDVDILLG